MHSKSAVMALVFSVYSCLPNMGRITTLLNVASESEFSWARHSERLQFLNKLHLFYIFKGYPEIVWGPFSIFHLKEGPSGEETLSEFCL